MLFTWCRWRVKDGIFAIMFTLRFLSQLYLVFGVFVSIDCNKCGQTSRLVVWPQIQTSCNFEKCLYNCNRYVGFVHCRHNKPHLEWTVIFIASFHKFVFLFIHHNFLLHENLLHAPSLPNSSWDQCGSGTTEASNSTEHSSIQKGSVQCTVGTGYIIYLLSAICHNRGLNWSGKRQVIFISLSY